MEIFKKLPDDLKFYIWITYAEPWIKHIEKISTIQLHKTIWSHHHYFKDLDFIITRRLCRSLNYKNRAVGRWIKEDGRWFCYPDLADDVVIDLFQNKKSRYCEKYISK
jgi:hypothetical protein